MTASCLECAADSVLEDTLVAGIGTCPDCGIASEAPTAAPLVPDLGPEKEEDWEE